MTNERHRRRDRPRHLGGPGRRTSQGRLRVIGYNRAAHKVCLVEAAVALRVGRRGGSRTRRIITWVRTPRRRRGRQGEDGISWVPVGRCGWMLHIDPSLGSPGRGGASSRIRVWISVSGGEAGAREAKWRSWSGDEDDFEEVRPIRASSPDRDRRTADQGKGQGGEPDDWPAIQWETRRSSSFARRMGNRCGLRVMAGGLAGRRCAARGQHVAGNSLRFPDRSDHKEWAHLEAPRQGVTSPWGGLGPMIARRCGPGDGDLTHSALLARVVEGFRARK